MSKKQECCKGQHADTMAAYGPAKTGSVNSPEAQGIAPSAKRPATPVRKASPGRIQAFTVEA